MHTGGHTFARTPFVSSLALYKAASVTPPHIFHISFSQASHPLRETLMPHPSSPTSGSSPSSTNCPRVPRETWNPLPIQTATMSRITGPANTAYLKHHKRSKFSRTSLVPWAFTPTGLSPRHTLDLIPYPADPELRVLSRNSSRLRSSGSSLRTHFPSLPSPRVCRDSPCLPSPPRATVRPVPASSCPPAVQPSGGRLHRPGPCHGPHAPPTGSALPLLPFPALISDQDVGPWHGPSSSLSLLHPSF